jgi:hypothetical protein
MALHHELPIYRDTYQLFSKVLDVTTNFPRDFKRLIGEKLRTECVEVMVLIFRANVAMHKEPHILELQERLQVVELLLRVSNDKRWISATQYSSVVELTQKIGAQSTGWKRYSQGQTSLDV